MNFPTTITISKQCPFCKEIVLREVDINESFDNTKEYETRCYYCEKTFYFWNNRFSY